MRAVKLPFPVMYLDYPSILAQGNASVGALLAQTAEGIRVEVMTFGDDAWEPSIKELFWPYSDQDASIDNTPTFDLLALQVPAQTFFKQDFIDSIEVYSALLVCLGMVTQMDVAEVIELGAIPDEYAHQQRHNAVQRNVILPDTRIITVQLGRLARVAPNLQSDSNRSGSKRCSPRERAVCGHYVRYRNGRVILRKAYTRGRGNPIKQIRKVELPPVEDDPDGLSSKKGPENRQIGLRLSEEITAGETTRISPVLVQLICAPPQECEVLRWPSGELLQAFALQQVHGNSQLYLQAPSSRHEHRLARSDARRLSGSSTTRM